MTHTFTDGERTEETTVHITRDIDGVYDGLGGQRRMLFPIPLTDGEKWSHEGSSWCTVMSLLASVRVPAGEFTHCLQVRSASGGDDVASYDRYYALGVGLVREDYSNEARAWSLKLISHNIPPDLFVLHCADTQETVATPLVRDLGGEGVLADIGAYRFSSAAEFLARVQHGVSTMAKGMLIVSPEFLGMGIPVPDFERVMSRVSFFVLHKVTLAEAARAYPGLWNRLLGETRNGLSGLVDKLAEQLDRTRSSHVAEP